MGVRARTARRVASQACGVHNAIGGGMAHDLAALRLSLRTLSWRNGRQAVSLAVLAVAVAACDSARDPVQIAEHLPPPSTRPTIVTATNCGLRPPLPAGTALGGGSFYVTGVSTGRECGNTWELTSPENAVLWSNGTSLDQLQQGQPANYYTFVTSNPYFEQNGAAQLSFVAPVRQVQIAVTDADMPGNSAVAYDFDWNPLAEVTFDYVTDQQGMLNESVKTLSAKGIYHVNFFPVANSPCCGIDRVGYEVTFVNNSSCPPTADQVFDDDAARAELQRQFDLSVQENLERSGWAFRNTLTGDVIIRFIDGPRTPCSSQEPLYPTLGANEVALGTWHTHPLISGFAPASCGLDPSAILTSGPSDRDRTAVIALGSNLKSYIWEGKRSYRLLPGLVESHARNQAGCVKSGA